MYYTGVFVLKDFLCLVFYQRRCDLCERPEIENVLVRHLNQTSLHHVKALHRVSHGVVTSIQVPLLTCSIF